MTIPMPAPDTNWHNSQCARLRLSCMLCCDDNVAVLYYVCMYNNRLYIQICIGLHVCHAFIYRKCMMYRESVSFAAVMSDVM